LVGGLEGKKVEARDGLTSCVSITYFISGCLSKSTCRDICSLQRQQCSRFIKFMRYAVAANEQWLRMIGDNEKRSPMLWLEW
jgi:hypothetical protein